MGFVFTKDDGGRVLEYNLYVESPALASLIGDIPKSADVLKDYELWAQDKTRLNEDLNDANEMLCDLLPLKILSLQTQSRSMIPSEEHIKSAANTEFLINRIKDFQERVSEILPILIQRKDENSSFNQALSRRYDDLLSREKVLTQNLTNISSRIYMIEG
jgi:hypothetical protein